MSEPEVKAAAAVRAERAERIVMSSEVPVLDTGMFDHMVRIAKLMASSSLVPAHLNKERKSGNETIPIEEPEAIANCFLVVNQATRWRMDPFAVAQHVFTTKGRIGYEGKLIAAVINTHPAIERRLTYDYEGTGEGRKVKVSAKLKGDDQPRTIDGNVRDWKTTGSGSPWGNSNQHDQMLSYRGAREWARRWLPEAILGVWGDDELEFEQASRMTASEPSERSAATRLANAVGGGTAAPADRVPPAKDVIDAEIVTDKKGEGEKKPAEPEKEERKDETAPAQATAKPAAAQPGDVGTPEIKQRYIAAFKASTDPDVLDMKRDELNFIKWEPADLKELDEAYRAQRTKLRGAA